MLTARPAPPATAHPADAAPAPGTPVGWVALGAAGVGAALLAARAASYVPGPCLARQHLGVACPACGLTHLADHLLHGRIGAALGADLPGAVLLALLAVTAVAQLVAWGRRRPVPALGGRVLPVALGALLLAHWALTAATGGATA